MHPSPTIDTFATLATFGALWLLVAILQELRRLVRLSQDVLRQEKLRTALMIDTCTVPDVRRPDIRMPANKN
jgi:hypothetical protein